MEQSKDYTTRNVRRHHEYYIPSGDIVIQVEMAIFKLHSHFLTMHSEVFRDMFAAPRDGSSQDGTESNPLVLSGDFVRGWELLLSTIYSRYPTKGVVFTGKDIVPVLSITHKYRMEAIENAILEDLGEPKNTSGYVDQLLVSRVVNSSALYQKALQGLISSGSRPTLEEAKLIGIEAYHEIVSKTKIKLVISCGCAKQAVWLKCKICGFHQDPPKEFT